MVIGAEMGSVEGGDEGVIWGWDLVCFLGYFGWEIVVCGAVFLLVFCLIIYIYFVV